ASSDNNELNHINILINIWKIESTVDDLEFEQYLLDNKVTIIP
ncbi:7185_t:CDS:1, partial [Entrophospora sp. SA101]